MDEDELLHYGTPRHSGRYPWGSGDTPYQRNISFLGNLETLRKKGLSEVTIAEGMGMNTTELRKQRTIANNAVRAYESAEALRLSDKGMTKSAIARRMGKNESSIRLLLSPALSERNDLAAVNAKLLKSFADENKYVDVGAGTEQYMGISYDKFKTAVALAERDGYVVHQVPIEQLGTGKDTNVRVLCPPGTEKGEVWRNRGKIWTVANCYSEDGGNTSRKVEPPKSISSDRVLIRYAKDGKDSQDDGSAKDGLLELRRGVDDISLNRAKYAQVRVAVDNTHYIKGMAVYGDKFPKGIDVIFNTSKKDTGNKLDALKPMKNDPDNPFGASIKRFDDQLILAQRHYKDKTGKEQLSVLNIVNEEGDWSKWRKGLASQMLAKQNPALAKRQLDQSYSIAKEEYDEIMTLTNPTVRATLLDKFANQCDSDAVHLQAAALPRQSTKVIIPFPDIKPDEVYAPNYNNGEHVVLIRYPHAGIFEIPTLVVNNKYASAKAVIENSVDAIGIHPNAAKQLSGADFDGDSVLVIPVDKVRIATKSPLKDLANFEPHEQYRGYDGIPDMTDRQKGTEMGKVSNLITDMTIKGATEEELCRAVKHSMVVIDAQKHHLDYKRSAVENKISELKQKYQGGATNGAATLLSRSTSDVRVLQRKLKAVSKMTPAELASYKEGKVIYTPTKRTFSKGIEVKGGEKQYVNKERTESSTRMQETDDAFTLVSGSPTNTTRIETVYAEYANSMKAMANQARKSARMEEDVPYSPSARQTYAKEYSSLNAKLNIALKNAPLERQAQIIANQQVKTKLYDNPELKKDNEHLKRLKGMELDAARRKVGAKKLVIGDADNPLTDREWEAINAGATTKTFLKKILANAKIERIRELATPRTSKGTSPGKVARAKSMLAQGHTQADVAEVLGISVSTLINAIGIENLR